MSDFKIINLNKASILAKSPPSKLGKWLPFLLIVSFMLANVYMAAQGTTADSAIVANDYNYLVFSLDLLFFAIFDYLIMLLVLWVYRLILSFRPYFHLVKVQQFNETFKFWYVIRNIIFGLFTLLLFKFPFLERYFLVLELLLSFGVVLLTYFSLQKHIDIMFRHMYFKLLLFPWFIYQAIDIVLAIIFGGV